MTVILAVMIFCLGGCSAPCATVCTVPDPGRPEALAPIDPGSYEPAAASPALTLSQLIRKYPQAIRTRGPRIKQVALTFDDVPDPRFTPQILNVLKKNEVKATFFIVGARAAKHPGLVKRILRDGHSIGNHSYNHPDFSRLGLNAFRSQITRTGNILYRIAGFKPRLIRPPYGAITENQIKWAAASGYTIVNWNVDSLDWKGLPKEEVKRNILSHTGRGSIILMHGGGGVGSNLSGTIGALPEVIRNLRNRGYTFVTVPELLGIPENKTASSVSKRAASRHHP